MLEHVAGLEVLKIEAGGFTVASLADGLVSGQDDFHYIVSFITVGFEGNRLSAQASSPAETSVCRALRATASSTIWPSTVPTPLTFSARILRALSTASALGVSAALIASICPGWMAALAGKPSATAAATSCFRPDSSCRSKKGESTGVTTVTAQAVMRRPLTKPA